MSNSPFLLDMTEVSQQMLDLNRKAIEGFGNLSQLRSEEIEVGCTPKELVHQDDHVKLYHYQSETAPTVKTPLLIVYALVNRPYMVDLQEDRSLVKNLQALGVDVYLIDWGYPGRTEKYITLEDYVQGYIDGCVDALCERHNVDKINILGICQGGAMSLCYSSLNPEKVKNLITMVTPVDFHVEGLLNTWVRGMNADSMVDAMGNIPGDFMNAGYLMLKPFALNIRKYIDMLDIMDDEEKLANFVRMEKWIFDSPDQAGEMWRQFIKDFYQGNKLIQGKVQIGKDTVNLKNITMPVLNIYADQDHLVPPVSSQALSEQVGSQDYQVHAFPVGHIGMYVSGKVQKTLPPLIANWLKERDHA